MEDSPNQRGDLNDDDNGVNNNIFWSRSQDLFISCTIMCAKILYLQYYGVQYLVSSKVLATTLWQLLFKVESSVDTTPRQDQRSTYDEAHLDPARRLGR